jgi:hypothetical protein
MPMPMTVARAATSRILNHLLEKMRSFEGISSDMLRERGRESTHVED